MSPAPERSEVTVEGRTLSLSNLDKPLYPGGFTKGQVVDYYVRIAPALLPHIKGRPVTLKRYPNGVEGQFFYEKNCPSHRPEWVHTAPVWVSERRRNIDFCLVDDVPTLVWTANLAALELHPSLALAEDLDRPTAVVFDLDPGPPADVLTCARVALRLREVLDQLGLVSVVKTSGSKGLQLYVPLNSTVDYKDGSQPFALALAQLLEGRHPELVVSAQRKELRTGKVLIDWSQNTRFKTTVAAYSLRARARPTVSTPVSWEEVERALEADDAAALTFETEDVLRRVERLGDLLAPLLDVTQELPPLA
jgi:bifunctional non-homologous end joining protein LigD